MWKSKQAGSSPWLFPAIAILLLLIATASCVFVRQEPNWVLPCTIMVDGSLYYTMFEEADADANSIQPSGTIKSTTKNAATAPTQNDTTNYTTCVGESYAWVNGQLLLSWGSKWVLCYPSS